MRNYEIRSISESGAPLSSAAVFLLLSLIGFMILGPLIGFLIASLVHEGSTFELVERLQNPSDPAMKGILIIVQGAATGIGLIAVPLLYMRYVHKKSISSLSPRPGANLLMIIVSSFLVISFMGVNSLFIEWNAEMNLPEFMSGLEEWMKLREDAAAGITEMLTTFDTNGEFLVAMLVIAVLPAIGEEIVFRGYIQTELTAGFRNPHIAVWVSAFLFSAIHMQFFGLIPRMLLGALFGYLYLWSGNLLYPVLAHFVNNAVQLLVLYLAQLGIVDVDIDTTESFPLTAVILFAFITFALLFIFRRYFSGRRMNV